MRDIGWDCRRLRIATLNVRTTSEEDTRIESILQLAKDFDWDIICLQEVRISADSIPTATTRLKSLGWDAFWGTPDSSTSGHRRGGVLTLSKWLATEVHNMEGVDTKRNVRIRAFRPGQRPLEIHNSYLESQNPLQRYDNAMSVAELTVGRVEDTLWAGYWNAEPWEVPAAHLLSAGGFGPTSEDQLHGNAEPTHGRRCLDYAIQWGNFEVLDSAQGPALADHDWVSYDVAVTKPPVPYSWPKEARINEDQGGDLSTRWDNTWNNVAGDFEEHLRNRDLDKAWEILSRVTESILVENGEAGAPRGVIKAPIQKLLNTYESDEVQSVKARRLDRTIKRWKEGMRTRWEAFDIEALKHKAKDIIEWYLIFANINWLSGEWLETALQVLRNQAKQDKYQRILNWKEKIQEDEAAMIRWIKAKAIQGQPEAGMGFSAMQRAEAIAEQLDKLWNPEDWNADADFTAITRARVADIAGQCAAPEPSVRIRLSGADLARKIQKGQHEAQGVDKWKGSHWTCMPDQFFHELARLWNTALEEGRVPLAWTQVRVVTIPKTDGGFRGLGIASVVGRAGMSAVIDKMQDWAEQWLHEDLVGGLKGRDATELHDIMMGDIGVANEMEQCFAGANIDLKKCFDTVEPALAVQVWQTWGADPGVTNVLLDFYQKGERWIECREAVHHKAIRTKRSLLQGCPASPLLLAGIMACWVNHVKARVPDISVRVYLDDRTLWAIGNNAPSTVEAALQAGAQCDKAFGLTEHPDKREVFSNTSEGRTRLAHLVKKEEHFKYVGR